MENYKGISRLDKKTVCILFLCFINLLYYFALTFDKKEIICSNVPHFIIGLHQIKIRDGDGWSQSEIG